MKSARLLERAARSGPFEALTLCSLLASIQARVAPVFVPKVPVATVMFLLTALAVTACGDDESLDASDSGTTSTSSKFPHLTDEYQPTCAGYTDKLRDCGILGDGPYSCTEPQTPTAECRYGCVTMASCQILSDLVCAYVPAEPLAQCLTKCDAFKCTSGESIVPTWVCDGEADCSDGSDEGSCFSCGSGEVFPPSYRCDFYLDCADGSDEAGCEGFRCGSGEVIPEFLECDLNVDCEDGSDEADCEVFVCDGTAESIHPHWQCDGQEDCLDGSDEVGCAVVSCP